MITVDGQEIYEKVKNRKIHYVEGYHCPLLLNIMHNPEKGTVSAFCVEAMIGENQFYRWLKQNELFREIYELAQAFSKENWERLGKELCEELGVPGTQNHRFEYWRMIGWARFGIGKNSRIRLDLDSKTNPQKHYEQLLEQASRGDFTAGEIKQLMEAINVGLNAHQVFALQKEIDQLKSDLQLMNENNSAYGNNSSAAKRVEKKD